MGKNKGLSNAVICRSIHQYSQGVIPEEDMKKLQEIVEDYRKVKNYVYTRYGGIGALSKLYPGYTIQNEMTDSGLRAELDMPSVYFYRAIFDALGDIKSQWTRTRDKVSKLVGQNENFTAQEKHYLRFLLKSNNAVEAVLNHTEMKLPFEMQCRYEELAAVVDVERLQRYLCRQIRKYHVRNLSTDKAEGFYITERAYRYGEEKGGRGRYGIFITAKEKRKRIFIPLTDTNAYTQQIYMRLKPEECSVEIAVPIAVRIKNHKDYCNELGLSLGMEHMLTTHEGNSYGEGFGQLHRELADYMSKAEQTYRREKNNNAGRKKYKSRKAKLDAKIETYVNQEINRMIEQEKPKIIYIPKLPGNTVAGCNKKINYSVNVWKKGLIRERLVQKCQEHSIEIVYVFGRGISTECSRCGGAGKYEKGFFRCADCGYEADKKVNAAKNVLKRGQAGQCIDKDFALQEESMVH